MLKGGAKEGPHVVLENFFSTIAVVHVEINDGHPVKAVYLQCMSRTYSNIIVQAEPHGSIAFSVVSGRPYATEGIFHFTVHYQIDRRHHRAGSAPGGLQGIRTDHRVRIEACVAAGGHHGPDDFEMRWGMYP